jgi:hypothetical protein
MIDFFNAPNVLYFLQRNITKRSRIGQLNVSPIWSSHKKTLKEYGACEKVFEFGAGKSLAQNLYLSDTVNEQLVVDLNPMIELGLVENVREQLSKIIVLKSNSIIKKIEDFEKYGIHYKAPYDASKTDLSDKSIDACISTNTLEHIPESSIVSIFSELRRTLKDSGIISAQIDYSDHYAHTDDTISLLNYLKFDDKTWKRYNHNCHYQNRLRHYDYLRIFKEIGFIVVEEELVFAESNIPSELIEAFKKNDETWKATSSRIVLKKAV